MRNWRATVKALTSSPRGFNADGRTLGLGLAAAMKKQRQHQATGDVEYLRTPEPQPVKTAA